MHVIWEARLLPMITCKQGRAHFNSWVFSWIPKYFHKILLVQLSKKYTLWVNYPNEKSLCSSSSGLDEYMFNREVVGSKARFLDFFLFIQKIFSRIFLLWKTHTSVFLLLLYLYVISIREICTKLHIGWTCFGKFKCFSSKSILLNKSLSSKYEIPRN
jgi:hypothetical protein